jgi:phosphatidylserine/phosphatidylglycerophosphate/cardiolipin synthase-like enzyme
MAYELAEYLKNENKIEVLEGRLRRLMEQGLVRGRDIIKGSEGILEKKLRSSLPYLLLDEGVITKEEASQAIEDYIFKFNHKAFDSYFSEQKIASKILKEAEEHRTPNRPGDTFEIIATVPTVLAVEEEIPEIQLIDPSLKRLIVNTENELWIANPFFDSFGTASILPALLSVAKSGVSVKIITRGFYDKDIHVSQLKSLTMIADGFIENGLSNQLEIKDFFKRSEETNRPEYALHSKIIMADEKECYLGSANVTKHGLKLNFELGVVIRGGKVKGVSKILKKVYEKSNYIGLDELLSHSK